MKHQSRLPAKVIGYLSQKPLRTNPQQDSLFSVIICIQREGPDGLHQLLLLSASQSFCEAVTPRSSFTNRITETYYLRIPNLQLLMLPSLLSWLSPVCQVAFLLLVLPPTLHAGLARWQHMLWPDWSYLCTLLLDQMTATPGKTERIITTSFAMERLFWLSVDICLFLIFCHFYFC